MISHYKPWNPFIYATIWHYDIGYDISLALVAMNTAGYAAMNTAAYFATINLAIMQAASLETFGNLPTLAGTGAGCACPSSLGGSWVCCVRCVFFVRSCRRRIDPPQPFVKSDPLRLSSRRHRCRCRCAWFSHIRSTRSLGAAGNLPRPPSRQNRRKVSLRSLHSLRRSLHSLLTNTYRVVSVRRSRAHFQLIEEKNYG